jgi:prevent-host-death family protein
VEVEIAWEQPTYLAKIAIMKTANVGTLRNNLSKFLDLVRKGETIEILDRKTPIARLTPIAPSMKPGKDGISPWMRKLAKEGKVRLGTGKLPPDFFDKLPGSKDVRIVEALLEERRNSR